MSTITEKMPHSSTKSMPTLLALCALAAFGFWGYQTKTRVIPFMSLSEEHHIGEEKPNRKRVVLRPTQDPKATMPVDDSAKSADLKMPVEKMAVEKLTLESLDLKPE